jgi:hypothetical protein
MRKNKRSFYARHVAFTWYDDDPENRWGYTIDAHIWARPFNAQRRKK